MDPAMVLLPSPLLGPATWQPVADRLARLGRTVTVPTRSERGPRTPDDVLAGFGAAIAPDRDTIIVAHSNAGLYVPMLVATHGRIRAAVFVDAGLPPATGSVPLAPPALLDHVASLADVNGILPPWTAWFPESDVAALFPDAATRREVESQQHRLPIDYFRATLAVPDGWDRIPAGYIAFGKTYDDEHVRAGERGWPTQELDGGHLHQLVAPGQVSTAIDGMASRLLPAG